MRKLNSKFCLFLALGLSLTACGKKSGTRVNLGADTNPNLNSRPSESANTRPGIANRDGTRPNSNVSNSKPANNTPCVNCTSDDDSSKNKKTDLDAPKANQKVLGTIEDDARRLAEKGCANSDWSPERDFDLDGLTDECEIKLNTNSQCYNGYLISGVRLDKQVLKSISTSNWFQKNLFRIGANTNKWVDIIIEELTKTGNDESISLVKKMFLAHWDDDGKKRDRKKAGGKKFPFRIGVTDDYRLHSILLKTKRLKDAGSFEEADDLDLNANQSIDTKGRFDFAFVTGGRAEPVLTDPTENGLGRITGLNDSADDLDGQGGQLIFTEAYLSKPGTYRFFTGVLLGNGEVQYTHGRGNYFVVTVGGDTILTSSTDLAARGKASPGDPSDKRTQGTYTLSARNKTAHLVVASIVRRNKAGGSFVNDTVFVQYTDPSGKIDTQTSNGDAADVLTFLRQDYAQISSGQFIGTEKNSILQKPLFDNLTELSEADPKYKTQIERAFYKGCAMSVADANTQISRIGGKKAATKAEQERLRLEDDQTRAARTQLMNETIVKLKAEKIEQKKTPGYKDTSIDDTLRAEAEATIGKSESEATARKVAAEEAKKELDRQDQDLDGGASETSGGGATDKYGRLKKN